MDQQLIKTLIDALQASGLDALEYSRGGETLRLSKGASSRPAMPPAPPAASPHPASPVPMAPPPAPGPAEDAAVSAPLYGVVHLRPAPAADPFVTVGQAVGTGTVLCTVEAMKVFTQVRASREGTVAAILVTDGQEVEPGQPLVRLA